MNLSAIDRSNACKLAVNHFKRNRNLNSKQEEIQSFVTFNLSLSNPSHRLVDFVHRIVCG